MDRGRELVQHVSFGGPCRGRGTEERVSFREGQREATCDGGRHRAMGHFGEGFTRALPGQGWSSFGAESGGIRAFERCTA